ncbi:MAG: phosphatase domain-containing protein [Chitinophagaceae bacterium]
MFLKKVNERHIRLYHGYGHTHDLLLYGHVMSGKAPARKKFTNNRLRNMVHLVRLFFIRPLPDVPLTLQWNKQLLNGRSEYDGFIKFEWASDESVPAGWHGVEVRSDDTGQVVTGKGGVFVPHITQYGVISDIDDTIMISYSATVVRRIKELFSFHPLSRKLFPDVAEHYRLLSVSHTTAEAPNPFFYVSSSEWNLYEYLQDVFRNGKLPEGAFLLSQAKRWFELLKTGRTKHQGKLLRVMRILECFPSQQFILFGDNTQRDPVIYQEIARKLPHRILAIYIRDVHFSKTESTRGLLKAIEEETSVYTCFFRESSEAIVHSRSIGLISGELAPGIMSDNEV